MRSDAAARTELQPHIQDQSRGSPLPGGTRWGLSEAGIKLYIVIVKRQTGEIEIRQSKSGALGGTGRKSDVLAVRRRAGASLNSDVSTRPSLHH